jgi:dTDP-4-amino-4,6-dideoxygalactose transaminase
LASGAIADGEEIRAFEAEFAAWLGSPDAVGVSSGFAALHLSLLALGVGPGDEVIVPCVSSCAAIRNAVHAAGATPVFADTRRVDFNLDAQAVARRVTPRTRAIIAPHHTGVPCAVAELVALGVPVIEDCAQALGATVDGRPVGTLGQAAIFSFYATKLMTTIDGGMVVSTSRGVVDRARDLRYYAGTFDPQPRYNYKLQNLHAALGRSQLTKLPAFLKRRRAIAGRYQAVCTAHGYGPECALQQDPGAVYFRFAVRLPDGVSDSLARAFRAADLPFGREVGFLVAPGDDYPHARQLSREVMSLPTYPALTDDEVSCLVRGLDAAFENARA